MGNKCCAKCAVRCGSPERSDPWGWMRLMECWFEDNTAFYCHESVPGHHQEVMDDRPRWRPCAGREALRNTTFDRALSLAPRAATNEGERDE